MAPLDTNVIIRYLTNDRPELSDRLLAFFTALGEGRRTVLLPEAVLLETEQVLSSPTLYHVSRPEIARHLGNIIRLVGVRLAHKRRYLRTLALYVERPALSFVDALLVAYAEETPPATVVSYDTDFDRVPGITRDAP